MQKKEGIKPESGASEKVFEVGKRLFGMYHKHYIHSKLYQKLYII